MPTKEEKPISPIMPLPPLPNFQPIKIDPVKMPIVPPLSISSGTITPMPIATPLEPQTNAKGECTPCQKKAYGTIANSICKDAEENGMAKGQCDVEKADLDAGKIDLTKYTKNLYSMLPETQKKALKTLVEIGVEKKIVETDIEKDLK
jgi:hypothetical protein